MIFRQLYESGSSLPANRLCGDCPDDEALLAIEPDGASRRG